MAYIGNTPGVSSQRYVQRETVTGSPKSAFIVTTGYSLGYVDVFVNGSQLDEADFTATDGVTVTLGVAAAVGDIVRIIAWLPRGLSDGYLKSESDSRFIRNDISAGVVWSAGNLGLAITPSAWGAGIPTLQVGSVAAINSRSDQMALYSNSYFDGTNFKAIITGFGGRYRIDTGSGAHAWDTITSVAAGANQSITQAMTLTATGQLLVGTTTAAQKLTIGAGSIQLDNAQYLFGKTSSGTATRLLGMNSANDVYIGSIDSAAGSLIFNFGGTSRAVLDASGRLGLGGAPNSRFDLGTYGSATQISWHTDTATSYGHIAIQNSSAALGIMSGLRMGAAAYSFESSISGTWGKAVVLLDYGRIRFFTNPADTVAYGSSYTPSERVRIESDGSFLVGTTTNRGAAGLSINPNTSAGAADITFNRNSTASTSYVVGFQNAGTTVGYIAYSNATVTYNTGSDARLKENVAPAADSGAIIDAIEIVQHDWISGGHADFSVIAQDLHPVYPQAVTPGDAGEQIKQTWGVDYSKMVPLLVKEIQSLRARLAALEAA